jgi:hypothetical protein
VTVAKYVVVTTATVPSGGHGQPARTVTKSQVLDLSASEVTAIGGSNLRAVTTSTMHDQLGESAGVSNGN